MTLFPLLSILYFSLIENMNANSINFSFNRIQKRRFSINSTNTNENVNLEQEINENLDDQNTNIEFLNFNENYFDLQKNIHSNLYTINLEIGSNRDIFRILLDSGSNILWIPSVHCTECSDNIKKLNHSNSETFKNLSKSHEIHYHDGSISKGYLGMDLVKIGNLTTNFTFLVSMTITNEISDIDGILGLGNESSNHSLINILFENNKIRKKIFSQIFNEKENTGVLLVGDYPNEVINNNFVNYSLCEILKDYSNQWVCMLESAYIKENDSVNNINITKPVVFDSGTNFMIFDKGFEEIFKKSVFGEYEKFCLKKYEFYFCQNEIESKLNPLYFEINGWVYKINTNSLIYRPENQSDSYFQLMVEFNNTDIWTFGFPFLNNFIVVYNIEDTNIGFYGGEREKTSDFSLLEENSENRNDSNPFQKKYIFFIILILFLSLGISAFVLHTSRKNANKYVIAC